MNSHTLFRRKSESETVVAYSVKNSIASTLTVVLFFALTLLLVLSSTAIIITQENGSQGSIFSSVYAQEAMTPEEELRNSQDRVQDMANDYMGDFEDEEDKDSVLEKLIEKAEDDSDPQGFGALIRRFFEIGYINETPNASNHNGTGGVNCNPYDPLAGTVMYHNCDVPNLFTQFAQSLATNFIQFGPQGAEISSASINNTAFGLPDNIPNGGAPVAEEDRMAKYTALELFGYNFGFTSYNGEWDDIRVQNSARTMSGMGAFDRIRATFKAYATGLGHATDVAVEEFTRQISSGDIMKAVGGFFTGFVTGGATATSHSIFDTSDQNVFNQNAWYRVNFAATMYGARELSSEEIAAQLQNLIVEYMGGVRVEDVEIPEDLLSIENPPELPEEAISHCSVIPQSEEITPAPGVDQATCQIAHQQIAAAALASGLIPPPFEWTVDGTRKQEPLRQYIDNYPEARQTPAPIPPNYFQVAIDYGLKCFPEGLPEDWDTSIPRRQEYGNLIKTCWADGWQEAVDNKLNVDQNVSTGTNTEKAIDPEKFQKWVSENPNERNYNAPWRRFVCLNMDGSDMRGINNSYVFLYNANGIKNPACHETRNPIQDGLFGNGYSDGINVANDTRNFTKEKTALATMIPVDMVFNQVANFGLSISIYATRISNTVINIAYGTVLDKIGIDKVAVKAVEELRDGVFFPLLVLAAALGGITIFIRILKSKDYAGSAKDLLILSFTAMFGIILLSNPAELIKQVEEVPATLERGILSAVFNTNEQYDDELCTTSSVNTGSVSENDRGKETLSEDSVRRLMCENWRVGAYNIWAFGQFGTSPNNLDVADMQNTNGNKVGNAQIHLGNGVYMNNWALYQLDTLSSGTASFPDPSADTGTIPRDFYRIVDLQAGINNGAGTDNRYFEVWTGQNTSQRMAAGIIGTFSSVATAVTVVTYSIAKIQISITMTLMLILMPFMLLIGLHPTLGRNKMKNYFATLVALGIQRVLLAAMLAVMFRIMIGIGNSSSNIALSCLAMGALAIAFFSMRQSIFNLVFDDVRRFSGEGPMGGDHANAGSVPGYIQNKIRRVHQGIDATAGGVIGGFAAGGVSGAEPAVKSAFNAQMAYIRRIQRYRGKGPVQTFTEAVSNSAREARSDLDRDPFAQEMKEQALTQSREFKKYDKKAKEYEAFDGEERKTFNGIGKFAADGTFLAKPSMPKELPSEKLSNRNARIVSHQAKRTKEATIKTQKKLERRGYSLDEQGNAFREIKPLQEDKTVEEKFDNRFAEPNYDREIPEEENSKRPIHLTGVPEEDEPKPTRPLTQQERIEINKRIEKAEKEHDSAHQIGTNRYKNKQNRQYTKAEMRKALIEAREKAGDQIANRRFF